MDLKKLMRIFAIFSIFFLFLLAAGCSNNKVYVCPTGEEVDRPAKCDMYEEQQAMAERVTEKVEQAKAVEEETAGETEISNESETAEESQPKVVESELVEEKPVETEVDEAEAVQEKPMPSESSPDFEFAILNLDRTKYKIESIAYVATNNLDKEISPYIELSTRPMGEDKYTYLQRFDLGKYTPGETKEISKKSIDERIDNVDQDLLFSVYDIDLSKGKIMLTNATYTIETQEMGNNTSI